MKILVVGYGSMGRRRIRIIKKQVARCDIYCVDSNKDRKIQAEKDGNTCVDSLEEALKETKYDCAFVCTSPGSHDVIIMQLVENKINVFTELNLVSNNYDKIIKMAKKNNVTVFMSSSKLYNKNIVAIIEMVKNIKKPLSYIYHVGQYLPDWHPWESYKDFFVGRKETNGVREILAIQLPWIIEAFGEVVSLNSQKQCISELDINYPDVIITTIKHNSGTIGVFISDVVSRCATTSLEIIGEDIHVKWGGHYNDLVVWDFENKKFNTVEAYQDVEHADGYSDIIVENQYIEEIRDFFDSIKYGTVPRYSIMKDSYTLDIIDQIEG